MAYTKQGNKHRPDIYIPHLNRLVEVKSFATICLVDYNGWVRKDVRFRSVQKKARACVNEGYAYTLLLFDKGRRIPIPKDWLNMTYREFRQK